MNATQIETPKSLRGSIGSRKKFGQVLPYELLLLTKQGIFACYNTIFQRTLQY